MAGDLPARSRSSPARRRGSAGPARHPLRRRGREGDLRRPEGQDETAAGISGARSGPGRRRQRGRRPGPRPGRAPEHGGLDIFFANAGISGGLASLFEQIAEDWQEILRVNLIGPFLAIKHAAPAMKERGRGSIICTASVAGLRAGAGGPAYSASKAGVINLVKVAAHPARRRQHQGQRDLPRPDRDRHDQADLRMARAAGKEDRIGHLNPLKRGGEPDEIANAALFLASDEVSYVNGHALVVDGGLSISHPFNHQEYGRTAF